MAYIFYHTGDIVIVNVTQLLSGTHRVQKGLIVFLIVHIISNILTSVLVFISTVQARSPVLFMVEDWYNGLV